VLRIEYQYFDFCHGLFIDLFEHGCQMFEEKGAANATADYTDAKMLMNGHNLSKYSTSATHKVYK